MSSGDELVDDFISTQYDFYQHGDGSYSFCVSWCSYFRIDTNLRQREMDRAHYAAKSLFSHDIRLRDRLVFSFLRMRDRSDNEKINK